MTQKRTVYFLMVRHPFDGRIRVGQAYSTRADAAGWRKFVRAAWRGLPVSIASFTFNLTDGRMDARSVGVLSAKFNMDPPALGGPR